MKSFFFKVLAGSSFIAVCALFGFLVCAGALALSGEWEMAAGFFYNGMYALLALVCIAAVADVSTNTPDYY